MLTDAIVHILIQGLMVVLEIIIQMLMLMLTQTVLLTVLQMLIRILMLVDIYIYICVCPCAIYEKPYLNVYALRCVSFFWIDTCRDIITDAKY